VRAGGLLVRLPVPLLEEPARPAEDRATALAGRWCSGCLGRAIARAVALHASLAVIAAVPERSARTAEAIERALPPGDVADAAENHQPPREVRTAPVVTDSLRLAALDERIPIPIVIRIVDQPEPTQNEQTDQ
jgi:hypothetical protein